MTRTPRRRRLPGSSTGSLPTTPLPTRAWARMLSVATPTDPTVFARVSQLSPEQLSQVSLDSLRNLFLPVTSSARQQAAASGQAFEGFELIRDDVLTSDGLRGVRSTYNYEISAACRHSISARSSTTRTARSTCCWCVVPPSVTASAAPARGHR